MAVGYVVALVPLAILVLLLLGDPGLVAPFFDDRIGVAGLPAGLVLLAFMGGLAAIGILIVRASRSWWAILVVVVLCVLPALFVLVFGPAIILIAINLWT